MPFRRRNYRSRRPRRYIKRRSNYRKSRISKPLRRAVKRIVDRKMETKEYFGQLFVNQGFVQGYGSAGVVQNANHIIPSILTGADDGKKIGDQIDIKRFWVKGEVCFAQATGLQAQYVRMMVISSKVTQANMTAANMNTQDAAAIFRNGTGEGSFTSVNQDIFAPINKERFRIHYDKVVLVSNNVTPTTAGTTLPLALNGCSNSFVHKFHFELGKHFKHFKYSESGNYPLQPTNHNCWLVFQACNCDGSTGDLTNAINGCKASAYAYVAFKDA